jgi:hypothetical protein
MGRNNKAASRGGFFKAFSLNLLKNQDNSAPRVGRAEGMTIHGDRWSAARLFLSRFDAVVHAKGVNL